MCHSFFRSFNRHSMREIPLYLDTHAMHAFVGTRRCDYFSRACMRSSLCFGITAQSNLTAFSRHKSPCSTFVVIGCAGRITSGYSKQPSGTLPGNKTRRSAGLLPVVLLCAQACRVPVSAIRDGRIGVRALLCGLFSGVYI